MPDEEWAELLARVRLEFTESIVIVNEDTKDKQD